MSAMTHVVRVRVDERGWWRVDGLDPDDTTHCFNTRDEAERFAIARRRPHGSDGGEIVVLDAYHRVVALIGDSPGG
jgi:hypothetical protein